MDRKSTPWPPPSPHFRHFVRSREKNQEHCYDTDYNVGCTVWLWRHWCPTVGVTGCIIMTSLVSQCIVWLWRHRCPSVGAIDCLIMMSSAPHCVVWLWWHWYPDVRVWLWRHWRPIVSVTNCLIMTSVVSQCRCLIMTSVVPQFRFWSKFWHKRYLDVSVCQWQHWCPLSNLPTSPGTVFWLFDYDISVALMGDVKTRQ